MRRLTMLFLALFLCLTVLSCKDEPPPPLSVIFLDVGQGDATLIRTEAGDILIDAGTEDSEALLILRLEQLGVCELSLAVFTHMDEDHIGGADAVLSHYPTEQVWLNGDTPETPAYQRMLIAAEKQGTKLTALTAGERHDVCGLSIAVLYPNAGTVESGNEGSIVLRMDYEEIGMIFSGDAEAEQEEMILSRFGAAHLDCELYKVGHHGSNTSSSAALLAAMTPDYAVISCGADNSFGHPTGEVLERLDSVGAVALRTDLLGEITFYSDGKRLWYCDD